MSRQVSKSAWVSSVALVLAAGTVGVLIGAQAPAPAPQTNGKDGRIAERPC